MKHLYFVRHGESEMNAAKLTAGRTDTPLTEKGRKQANTTGLSAKEQRLIFDKIFASPLQRAHHTAKGIVKHLDYEEDSIELLDLIKERNFGELEGKNVEKDFGLSLDMYFENEASLDHIENIEKLEDLHKRAEKALEFFKQQPDETILIVAHGAFGRALYRVVHQLPYNAKTRSINNAEIIKLI